MNKLMCLVVASSVFLASCANFYGGVSKSMPYLRSSSYIVSVQIFEHSVNTSDRARDGALVASIAETIEKLSTGDVPPTPETFAALLSAKVPNSDVWSELITSLIMIYSDVYVLHPPSENQKILLDALSRIASGVRAAAERYKS